MPTYEYQCAKCGAVFDVFQSITAAPLRQARCESCDETRPVHRLIGTGGAVIFKGSGFYQTDYRSDNYKKAAKEAGGDKCSVEKSEGKADGTESTGSKGASSEKVSKTDKKPSPPSTPKDD